MERPERIVEVGTFDSIHTEFNFAHVVLLLTRRDDFVRARDLDGVTEVVD